MGSQRPPAVDRIKFDNDDRPGYKTLLLPATITSSSWQATVIFCSLAIIIKNFNSINIRRPWLPILIPHFFTPGARGQRPHAPGFLKSFLFVYQFLWVCLCVSVSTLKGINNKWRDMV